MKVFLDTNVIVSAFGTRGLCADLIRLVIARHELTVSEVVLEEVKIRICDITYRLLPSQKTMGLHGRRHGHEGFSIT